MSTGTFDERVAVIVGSTRPTRICPRIAEWTQRTLSEQSPLRHYQTAGRPAAVGKRPGP